MAVEVKSNDREREREREKLDIDFRAWGVNTLGIKELEFGSK